MDIFTVIAVSVCGLLWAGAIVEFSCTIIELNRCRHSACRLLASLANNS